MEQIIPDNENIEDYFDEDEVDEWGSLGIWNTSRTQRCIESLGG